MAVPKKKTSRSITSRRKNNWYMLTRKKLNNFVERAKRNARGAQRVADQSGSEPAKSVTKIEA